MSEAAQARIDVTLLVGDAEVGACRAHLSRLSSVLKEAFDIDPRCQRLKVDGDHQAWQFLAATAGTLASDKLPPSSLPANDPSSAQLVTSLLPIAREYNMPAVTQLCVGCAADWSKFKVTWQQSFADFSHPFHPAFWVNLAAEHDFLCLAAPGLLALVKSSNRFDVDWRVARALMREYGAGRTEDVWRLVCHVLAGCDG